MESGKGVFNFLSMHLCSAAILMAFPTLFGERIRNIPLTHKFFTNLLTLCLICKNVSVLVELVEKVYTLLC